MHSCGPHISANFDPTKGNNAQSYDESLTTIKGANVAINLSLWTLRKYTPDFIDFYIYSSTITKGSVYKDQLFLQTNGQTFSLIFPFDIQRVPPAASRSVPFDKSSYSHFDDSWNTKVKDNPIPTDNDKLTYGTGLHERFRDDLCNQKRQGFTIYMNGAGFALGKNFHFIESFKSLPISQIKPSYTSCIIHTINLSYPSHPSPILPTTITFASTHNDHHHHHHQHSYCGLHQHNIHHNYLHQIDIHYIHHHQLQ